jgi:phosphatidyl-myo-inositol alpha-mannosyltransferase
MKKFMNKQSSTEKRGSRPLKVGFVFDDSLDSFDGVSQYVKALGSWLVDQGHDVNYLVGETTMRSWAGGKIHSLAKNLKVSFNRNKLTIPLPADHNRIKKLLSKEKYDILHVQMPHSPFMAGRVVKLCDEDTAVVGTFHILPAGILAQTGSYALRLVYGRSLRRFDAIFSVSDAAASFAKKVIKIESEVLPNVIDLKKYAQASPAQKSKSEIIFLGRLVKRKGCLELLKAFGQARKDGMDAKLIVAGNGPERLRLERYVIRNRLQNDVEFLGFVDEDVKPALLARADIACFPATGGESFGIVLLEAMAAGSKVVLGGDNPGYRSVLGGKPLLLIDPRQTSSFADRLVQLLNDEPEIEEASRWLREEIKKYDVARVGKQLEAVYHSTIAKRSQNIHNRANETG